MSDAMTTITATITDGARLLSGKPVAAALNAETQARVAVFVGLHGYAPILAAVSVGATPDGARYMETLRRSATSCWPRL